MTDQLEVLLGHLHSDDNRLRFLRAIYTPGNTMVADRILAMNEDSSVMEKEIAFAQETGNTDRFRHMAQKRIDYYVAHDCDITVRDLVIKWQDPELADYAITQMSAKPEADRKLGTLEYAADIAQAFGKEEVAKATLERLLALQERDSKYKFPAAGTLKKLGRFDEAIDRYLESGYGWFSDALQLAQEHSPKRIVDVVVRGLDPAAILNGFAEFHVECAKIAGKTQIAVAENNLVRYATVVSIEKSPRFYNGVVKALVSVGQEKVARELVEKVALHEQQLKASGAYNEPTEMALLYHAIGEIDAVRTVYAENIETAIRERHHPSNIVNAINRAIELTGDKATFMEKKLLLHERLGEYDQAATLATELGKPELAESYHMMHHAVQSVQPPK